MAAKNKPAGIRSLVYGIDKGKAGIEGLSVSELGSSHEKHQMNWIGSEIPLDARDRSDFLLGQIGHL